MQFSFSFGCGDMESVRDRLLEAQGPQRDLLRHGPESQFVKAVVSSRTRDSISGPVFHGLERRYDPWGGLATAAWEELLTILTPVQFADRKADQLMRAADRIISRRGRFSLAFLRDWSVPDATRWVRRLPGAGPKVAAATLNFSTLRKRTFAADTHILRLSRRLGLLPGKAGDVKAHRLLLGLMPDRWDADDLCELHWLMKAHGQTVCTHGSPRCGGCVLKELCASCRTKGKRIH